MPCFNPYQLPNGPLVRCGRCPDCLEAYSKQWVDRMLDELVANDGIGCFLTLTYDDEHLPRCGQCVKRPFQLFIKRLRKYIAPAKVRYYACGEYGSKRGRPHYHAILFGWYPDDFVSVNDSCGRSETLQKLWSQGFVNVVVDLNADRLKYCTKYMQKLDDRWHTVRPWNTMSRRPGIGAGCLSPSMLLTGVRYRNGVPYPLPRFYLDKLEEMNLNVEPLKAVRKSIASDMKKLTPQELRSLARSKENELRQYARARAITPLLYQ